MFSRILVPLDGSPFAEGALPVAVAVAQRAAGELHLVSVVDAGSEGVPDAALQDRTRTREYLEAVTERIRQVWSGPIHSSVREGRVERELGALLKEWDADLLVMSTHGRSGVSRLWMGSIAERCVRSGFGPTLLVRPPETRPDDLTRLPAPTRIVVPLDGSEAAERAIPFGVALSSAFDAPTLLLRVLNQPRSLELTYHAEAIAIVRRLRAEDRSEAREYLSTQVERLRERGSHAYSVLMDELGPAEAIVDRSDGDWVVITTNGLGGVERAFFGSVADKVVRSCKQPLLVVPPARSGPSVDASDVSRHSAAGAQASSTG